MSMYSGLDKSERQIHLAITVFFSRHCCLLLLWSLSRNSMQSKIMLWHTHYTNGKSFGITTSKTMNARGLPHDLVRWHTTRANHWRVKRSKKQHTARAYIHTHQNCSTWIIIVWNCHCPSHRWAFTIITIIINIIIKNIIIVTIRLFVFQYGLSSFRFGKNHILKMLCNDRQNSTHLDKFALICVPHTFAWAYSIAAAAILIIVFVWAILPIFPLSCQAQTA